MRTRVVIAAAFITLCVAANAQAPQKPRRPAQELNPQKARVLLMLALAAKYDARKIAELFRTPN